LARAVQAALEERDPNKLPQRLAVAETAIYGSSLEAGAKAKDIR
jgi:hypothetical protein